MCLNTQIQAYSLVLDVLFPIVAQWKNILLYFVGLFNFVTHSKSMAIYHHFGLT